MIFKLKKALIAAAALVLTVHGAVLPAYAEGDNDNFGELSQLVDIAPETLVLKADSSFLMTDALLKSIPVGTTCADIISAFENKNVAVRNNDGDIISTTEAVKTSDTVVLTDADGSIIDSRTLSVKGDANCDGEADTVDATVILKYDSGLLQLDAARYDASDVSADGDVDTVDAVLLLRYDSGLISGF